MCKILKYIAILVFGDGTVDRFISAHQGEEHTSLEWKELASAYGDAPIPLNADVKQFDSRQEMDAYVAGVKDSADPSVTDVIIEGISDSMQAAEAEVDETQKWYNRFMTAKKEYRMVLLDSIKQCLSRLTTQVKAAGPLRIGDYYADGCMTPIAKYWTPKDDAANYILNVFGLDKDGRLFARGEDSGDSRNTYTFGEDELETEDLMEINDVLSEIASGVFDDGTLFVSKETGEVIERCECE